MLGKATGHIVNELMIWKICPIFIEYVEHKESRVLLAGGWEKNSIQCIFATYWYFFYVIFDGTGTTHKS